MKIPVSFSAAGIAIVLTGGTLALSGCGSGAIPRDLMSEAVRSTEGERPVAMRGESTFLEGKLAAMATVSRGFDRGTEGRGLRPEERRGRRRDEDAFSENYNLGFGESEEEQKAAMEEYMRLAKARRAAGSPMPPVTLRVQFANRGTEPMVIAVPDVDSYLGNFVALPRQLTIAPGETGVLDPMVSQLGVTSDEIPLKLSVRIAGKTETQTVLVKNIILPTVK